MSRMSKERTDAAMDQQKTISDADYAKVKAIAEIVRPLRSVIHKTPDDYGMTDRAGIRPSNCSINPGHSTCKSSATSSLWRCVLVLAKTAFN